MKTNYSLKKGIIAGIFLASVAFMFASIFWSLVTQSPIPLVEYNPYIAIPELTLCFIAIYYAFKNPDFFRVEKD